MKLRKLSALLARLTPDLARLRRCPECPHDKGVHGRYGCLAAVYDDAGHHDHWCYCKRVGTPT